MNFKGNALTVFFSFASILLLAQTTSISKISVKWDERDEEKVLSMDESFLLEDGNLLIFSGQQAATNGGLVSIGGGKQFQLSILDKERNIVKTESYKPGSICGGCNVGQAFKLGDRYLVSMIPDKDRNNPMIFEINMATLEISDTKKNLESFEDGIDQTTLTLNKEEIGFHLRGAIVKNKSELFYLTLRMYDTNLNAVLDQEIEIPFKKAELLSYDVDREGNVYVLVAIYHKGRDDKGKKKKEWIKKLYVTSPKDSKIEVIDIEKNEDKWLADIDLKAKEDGEGIILCGQFHNKETVDKKLGRSTYNNFVERQGEPTAGKVMMRYNRTSGFSERVYTPFKKSILKPSFLEKEREKNKKKKKKESESLVGLPNLEVNEIINLENGNIVELSEGYKKRTDLEHGSAKTNEFLLLGKIVVTVFSPEGEVVWIKSIDRIHKIMDWGVPFSTMFIQRNSIGVVFVDGKSSYVYLYDMDTGKRKKKALYKKDEKVNLKLNPAMTKRIDDNTVIIHRTKGKKVQFGRIIFE